MLGAIVGDTVGSHYEFNNTKDYNFQLFHSDSSYTDDSIMTLAENTGAIPPIEGAADLTKSVLSDSVYETYAITEKGYTPVTGGFAMTEQSEVNIRDDIYNTLNSIMAGEKNVDEWSELIESDSNKLSEIVLK